MITVLTGENTFESSRILATIIDEFQGTAERIDGVDVTLQQLPDLLSGATLFADKRLVIIRGLSDNKSVWNDLAGSINRVSDDVHVVLIDTKLDKRTKTYKELKKLATIHDSPRWTDRDVYKAETWVTEQAAKQSIKIDKNSVRMIVERVGMDQWQLSSALDKLSVLDDITPRVIEDVIDANPIENVFNLLDAALKGQATTVSTMIRTLEMNDDAYMVFGLLASQIFQLAALAVADDDTNVASSIGAHPFVLSKLSPYAKQLGHKGVRPIVVIMAECDDAMKTSSTEPWLLIERALVKVAAR